MRLILTSMKKVAIFLLMFLPISNALRATHVAGAEMSYQCTSTSGVYKVSLKIYKDCAGSNLCSGCSNAIPNGTTAGCTTAGLGTGTLGAEGACNGINYGSFSLAAVTGANAYDIIQTCAQVKTICNNCNTRTAGTFAPAIEVFIFEGNVDLNTLPSTCCKARLAFSLCCRSGSFGGSSIVYEDVIIDRCAAQCNGSPTFTNNIIPIVCAGQDFVYNLGAIDPDGDSLSYAFGEAYQAPETPINWTPPFSAAYPFNYLGAPNANATYPGGLRIDPITGDIIFRPIGVFSANLVIEVKQWKLVGGTWINVGTTRRNAPFQTILCTANSPPKIKIYRNGTLQSTQSFSVCAGEQICLDIVAEDQSQISPSLVDADTTFLTWNNPGQINAAMSNATWIANYIVSQRNINGPKADSFKFCWTPSSAAARNQPYSFTVGGIDQLCPIPSSVTRGIIIKVTEVPKPIISQIDNLCGNRSFSFRLTNPLGTNLNTSASMWQIEQTPGNSTAPNTGSFVNINAPTVINGNANNGLINYKFTQEGTYKIRLLLSNTWQNMNSCASLDSNYIINKKPLKITAANANNCIGSPITIIPRASGGNRPSNTAYYQFFLGDISSTNSIKGAPLGFSIDSTLTVTPNNIGGNTAYKVKIKDFDGCEDSTSFNIFTRPPPMRELVPKIGVCIGADTSFFAGNNNGTALSKTYWYKQNSPNVLIDSQATFIINNAQLSDANTYLLHKTDIYGCTSFDTTHLLVNRTPQTNFTVLDSAQCLKTNNYNFINTSEDVQSYIWQIGNGFTSNSKNINNYKFNSTGIFTIKLLANNNGCKDSISKMVQVLANATDVNFSINSSSQCLANNNFVFTNSSIPDNSSLSYLWVFGDGNTSSLRSPTIKYNTVGNYTISLKVTANQKCVDSISQNVKVNASPIIGAITGNSTPSNPGVPFSYTLAAQSSTSTYNWTVNNGTIQSGQGSKTVSILFTNKGAAKIFAQITDSSNCTDSTSLAINVQNVGVQNIDINAALSIYPNPGKTVVTINNKSKHLAGKEYRISNLVGQTILSGKLGIEETQVNIESLSSGLYLLSIAGISSQSIKIIKE